MAETSAPSQGSLSADELQDTESASYLWLPEIVQNIARFLSPNVAACTLRLVNKATADQFAGYTILKLSLYSPEYAFVQHWTEIGALRSCTFKQRRELLCLTASSDSIPNLKTALAAITRCLTGDAFTPGLHAGEQPCCWLQNHGCFWFAEMLAAAAGAGQKAVCEWLIANGCPWDCAAVYFAACGGHIDLLGWLLQQQPPHPHSGQHAPPRTTPSGPAPHPHPHGSPTDPATLLLNAARGCDLPTLQRLYREWAPQGPSADSGGAEAPAAEGHEQQPLPPAPQPAPLQPVPEVFPGSWREQALATAACSATTDWQAKVEWLETLSGHQPQGGWEGVCCAVAGARLPVDEMISRLAWLQQRGYPANRAALVVAAAAAGSTAVLRYLLNEADAEGKAVGRTHRQRLQGSAAGAAATAAAAGGHLAALQLLHAHGWPLDPLSTLLTAAMGGHLAVVVWVAESLDVEWGEQEDEVVFYAAQSGSLALLRWLVARGCQVQGRMAVEAAARAGCEEVLEWLVEEQGCSVQEDERPYEAAACNGDVATLRCLVRLGVPMQEDKDRPYEEAARKGHVATLRCLRRLGYPWRPTPGTLAQWVGRLFEPHVLQWLVEDGEPAAGGCCRCPVDWEAALVVADREPRCREEVKDWLRAGGGGGAVAGWDGSVDGVRE